MSTVPNQQSPQEGGTRPLRVFDFTPTQHASVPPIGPSGDGADARTPEAPRLTGACTPVPMPDNTGPTTSGGTSLGDSYGK